MIQTCIEICFVLCQIGDAWQVNRHNANRTGAFPAAEEATALFAQFAQIKTQTAAHAAHITWFHITVNIIRKIWSTIFCRHFKQQAVVFCFRPVKIFGNRIRWNWILEATALCIPIDHNFDESFVDHVHFTLAVAISEIHIFPANDGWKIF